MNIFRKPQIIILSLSLSLGFDVFTNQSIHSYPIQQLENAAYYLPDVGMISLVNGRYQDQNLSLILDKNVAFGDLNGDGIKDAVVFLMAFDQGTNTSTYIAVLIAQDGQLQNVDTLLLEEPIQIQAVSIEAEQLYLKFRAFSANDLPCCPSQKRQQHYRFDLTSQTLMPLFLEAQDNNRVQLRLHSPHQSEQNQLRIKF